MANMVHLSLIGMIEEPSIKLPECEILYPAYFGESESQSPSLLYSTVAIVHRAIAEIEHYDKPVIMIASNYYNNYRLSG
jgi:hypothetical protein